MDSSTASFSLLELFNLGGIFMWPLLLFSILTITISVERIIFLGSHNLKMEDLKQTLSGYIRSNKYKEAKEYLIPLTKRRMGARILLPLVEYHGLSDQRLEKYAETEAAKCINSLENGFSFLVALGSLSPLTGFLGTVSGMIGAFRSIAEATEVNAQIVANGIYEALITTVFGLIIAIIAMIANSLFTHVVDKFSAEVEQTCSNLIMEITLHHES